MSNKKFPTGAPTPMGRGLDRELIEMNLPIMDYLDDFDRGIILAAAYKTITNDKKKLIDILDDIYNQPLSVTLFS